MPGDALRSAGGTSESVREGRAGRRAGADATSCVPPGGWWKRLWRRWTGRVAAAPPPPGETAAERKRRVGRWGEDVAAAHLKAEGWKILGRNVRFGSRMELDIVARQKEPPVLVFVEVKTRKSELAGRPASAVDAAKRRAQDRAARKYLQRLGTRRPAHWRFDVVEVVGDPDSGLPPAVRRIEGAWTMSGALPG